MDPATLDRHAALGRPLTAADRRNLRRLLHDDALADCHPVIAALLERDIKLEQEVVAPAVPL